MSSSDLKLKIRNSKLLSGAALMLSLWALFLLSALVISWALDIDSRLALSGNANRSLEAEAMACSGAEVALAVKPGSPNLNRQFGGGKSYEARITGEGGRLDINWLVTRGPERLEILRRFLEIRGVDLNERDGMIDSLLDWVSPNLGLHRLNAPPESENYHPPHALLARIDELKNVAGWTEFTSTPGWDDDFTVNTMLNGGGLIDLAWASRDVLLALPGTTPDRVDRFLELRRGPDGIDGTADDAKFGSPNEALVALGLNVNPPGPLASLTTLKVPVFRVVSVGKAGNAMRTVQMVFRKGQGGAQVGGGQGGAVFGSQLGAGFGVQLITWKEF